MGIDAMQVTVVHHPWQAGREERGRLVQAAADLAPQAAIEVLAFTGASHPAAVAAHLAQQLAGRAGRHLVLLPTGTESEAIAAQLACRLGGTSLGRCTAVEIEGDAVLARRAAFGGRVELALRSSARITCATLRPAGQAGVAMAPGEPTVIELQEPAPYLAQPQAASTGQPRVEGAALVVSGGRGIGGAEGFAWLERIATALGAGLGGSLPAVDAGWVPVAHQVGQSGKFVTPGLYFAVGISGTPQHMAGISPETRIVALNSDRAAAIFARCDIAVEADWREVLPLLAQRLETRPAPLGAPRAA